MNNRVVQSLHLLLVGDPGRLGDVVAAMNSLGHRVTVVATAAASPFVLQPSGVVENRPDSGGHDALIVLADGVALANDQSATAIPTRTQAERQSQMHGHRLVESDHDAAQLPVRTRRFEEGERIIVDQGFVAEIVDGTVSVSAVHSDGVAMLIGILPPGDFIIPHPPDSCHTELVAHTDVQIAYWTWAQASSQRRLGLSLFSRILRDEAWAASQAHPYFEQRLVGILRLLGEWFGTRRDGRTLLHIRLTHGQLAAITSTTRPTVTRVLTMLQKTGQVGTIGSGPRRRFWIADDAGEGVPVSSVSTRSSRGIAPPGDDAAAANLAGPRL